MSYSYWIVGSDDAASKEPLPVIDEAKQVHSQLEALYPGIAWSYSDRVNHGTTHRGTVHADGAWFRFAFEDPVQMIGLETSFSTPPEARVAFVQSLVDATGWIALDAQITGREGEYIRPRLRAQLEDAPV